jgi:S-adenosylmethionine:tRNA ribosyltransferase-isomerase
MLLTLADFDYDAARRTDRPGALAATLGKPPAGGGGRLRQDSVFVDLPQWLRAGDLLVLNDSRVLHARLLGHKESGGRIEILVERLLDHATVLAQLRASKPPQPGSRLRLEDAFDVEVLGRDGEFYRLRFSGDAAELVERHGRLPLPPYIERVAGAPDENATRPCMRAKKARSPRRRRACILTSDLFSRLRGKGVEIAHVTLHVGAGTFQPVRVSDLAQHRMHTERYHLPQATADAIAATRARGGRIVAVGTTSLRVLESAALDGNEKSAPARRRCSSRPASNSGSWIC